MAGATRNIRGKKPALPRTAPTARKQADAPNPKALHLVVGIGASAGGLDAFRTFFSVMPADSGMTFVLVQHLDPDHASALVQILRGSTSMEVAHARDGARITPNRVYIIPPDAILTLAEGVLKLDRPAAAADRRTSINTFLTSLADDQGENAVGIILSGFGSDGALGVEAIKAHGGLTLTQADFDHHPKAGMPQSAAASGFVDHVLPVAKMPAALIEYATYRSKTDGAKGPDGVRKDVADHLGAICAVLNSRLGRDFSQYKSNTIMRRVQRRMQVLRIDEVEAYVDQLRKQPREPELLFREVLIRVTRFFRDPAAFAALAARIPAIVAGGGADDPIRAWVAGCATGEEAYSIAILFAEAIARAPSQRRVQIFATDIDDRAIQQGRAGLYPDTIAADVSADRLEQYFVRENEHYRVSKAIRATCLFSVHDLVKDPPFSKLDLVSCRNALIYFGTALQTRAVAMFHYGLRQKGVLFLGSSEAVAAHGRLFSPFDRKHRLFEKVDAPMQPLRSAGANLAEAPSSRSSPGGHEDEIGPMITRAMARFAPAFVVADRRWEVQRFSGPVAKFLEPTAGAASLNLASLIHSSLRAPLRAAMKKVAATHISVTEEGLAFEVAGRVERVDLVVEPLGEPEGADGRFLVVFQEAAAILGRARAGGAVSSDGGSAALDELTAARERLQSLTEELETANEELQSSNEEYQSINEELQSTNEELETSKEELQSINEELHTVNAELNDRNETLVHLNSDLTNLIDSTSIATLFLDGELRIRRFTPAVLDLFNLRPGDEGRPITDIVSHLARNGVHQDVREVIRTLVPISREVSLRTGDQTYQMQIRPYRDLRNVINGAVVTFVDITERKRHEDARANLAAIVEGSEDAIIGHDLAGRVLTWNAGATAIYGYTPKEAIGLPVSTLLGEKREDDWPALLVRLQAGETISPLDTVRMTKSGRPIDVSLTISPIRNSAGVVIGASAVARDIAARKRTEQQSALLLGELDHRVKNVLAVVSAVIGHTLKSSESVNSFATAIEGRLTAISRAHSLLTEAGKADCSLDMITRTELAPYGGGVERVTISGGDIALTPKAGMMIAMAIHELTTNAAKFGALSTTAGRLSVTWEVAGPPGQPMLGIRWVESGGPLVQPPTRRGFGTIVIERVLADDFDAEVARKFLPSGLECLIDIPLTSEVGAIAAGETAASAPS